jgi:hypothetical protein
VPAALRSKAGVQFLHALDLPLDARERIRIAVAMIESIELQLASLESELRSLARRQAGCRALSVCTEWAS